MCPKGAAAEPCHSNPVWNDWDARLGHGAAAHPDLPEAASRLGCSTAVSAPAEHHKAAAVQKYTRIENPRLL